MEIRGSIFCEVRETGELADVRVLLGGGRTVRPVTSTSTPRCSVSQCKAAGGGSCTMAVTILGERAPPNRQQKRPDGSTRDLSVLTATRRLCLIVSRAGAQGLPASETLVMPFDNPQTDPKLFWLGEGSAVLLSRISRTLRGDDGARETSD